ncbi:MAG: hypothetical protein R3324_18570, partial [Halobacteriales archaeon]|nr:hypothetical protein [Halobacteriales archaeon]
MPIVLVHPDLPLGIDGSRLTDRRPDLTVRRPTDRSTFVTDLPKADMIIISNGAWDNAYLSATPDGAVLQSMSAGNDRIPVDRL